MTTRTLMLLHHLQMNADGSKINFRQKLMFPPRRFSNALWHMFTVTLGRISYAYPPAWVGMENAVCLDHICGKSATNTCMTIERVNAKRSGRRGEGGIGCGYGRPRTGVDLECISHPRRQAVPADAEPGG